MNVYNTNGPDYLIIGGSIITYQSIIEGNYGKQDFNEYYLNTLQFCKEWLTGANEFPLSTSGSTGAPKKIIITREQMIASAKSTAKAINLKEGDTTLVCLNTQYIAGIMMLVRGFEIGMAMIIEEPSSHPLINFPDDAVFDFMSFVPLQIGKILESMRTKRNILNSAKAILIGGAEVNAHLRNQIEKIVSPTYSTYGMTETVSHIALQRLNGKHKKDYYTTLEDVQISIDDRQCLIITSSTTNYKPVLTNDIAKLISYKDFILLGRFDQVINSGGVKVFPDKIENLLSKIFEELNLSFRYFISSLPHSSLGQQVTLFIEGNHLEQTTETEILAQLATSLTSYELPKEIIYIPSFKETPTAKIDRSSTVKLILSSF